MTGAEAKDELSLPPPSLQPSAIAAWFVSEYKSGGIFDLPGYECDDDNDVYLHTSSGIRMWQHVIDLSDPE